LTYVPRSWRPSASGLEEGQDAMTDDELMRLRYWRLADALVLLASEMEAEDEPPEEEEHA
jgi:hypothetical protein